MKVAFFFRNEGIKHIDCSSLEYGNPGIGGTHFVMLQVASYLSKGQNDIEIFLFVEAEQNLPKDLNVININNEESLPENLVKNNIDILVVNKTTPESFSKKTITILKQVDVSVIVWAHVFMPVSFMNMLAKEPIIKLVIAVSKHQYYTYVDHPIFEKSTYIYNLCNFHNPVDLRSFEKKKNDVIYIGAINYIKGVHILLQQSPKVRRRIPDANLYIIGSGHLYSKSDQLGKFGIAEKYYEHLCLRKILNKDGSLNDSVHFLGVLGVEKWDYLSKAKVGIVNTHYWETFGFTAIEMQLAAVPVVSYKSPGLLDTVCSKHSILYERSTNLANYIIEVLRNNNDKDNDVKIVQNKFNTEDNIEKWISTLLSIYNNSPLHQNIWDNELRFVNYQLINKKISRYIPFLPSLLVYHELFLNFRRFLFNIAQPRKIINKIRQYAQRKNN